FATSAAEAVGRTLGTIVGTVERLRAEHPHPIAEAQEVIAQGQAQATHIAANVSERAAAVTAAAKRGITRIRKAAKSSRARSVGKTKKVAAAVKRPAKKTAKAAKRVVRRAKTAAKAAKRVVGRAKKAARKGRAKA